MKLFTALALFAVTSIACRADVESGPKADEKVGELKVSVVVGEKEGKEIDIAADRKDAPTVYLFVNAEKFSRPMARFMKKVDEKIGDVNDKAEVVAVIVGGDVTMWKDRLPKIQMSIKLAKTSFSVFDGAEPKGSALNNDAHITAVVAVKGKVVKSFALVSVNEKDEEAVIESLTKAVKK